MYVNAYKPSLLLVFYGLLLFSACNPNNSTKRLSSREYTKSHRSHKSKKVNTTKKYAKSADRRESITSLSSTRKDIISEAKKHEGLPYHYGGKRPEGGFDCSGLISYSYSKAGVNLSGSSSMLAKQGKARALGAVVPGDLLFFGTRGKVSHVAMAYKKQGNDVYVIHATSKAGVRIDNITSSKYWMNKYLFTRDLIDK